MESQANEAACPLPDDGGDARVTLAHGEGGRLMRALIAQQILPALGNRILASLGDAAILPPWRMGAEMAMTTDSFVVSPLFFPGGDIGKLAVYGTVNDLAAAGARPQWLSLSLIVEEGLPLAVLQRVLASVAEAARETGTVVVTGDTKVVPRGAADGLFLNTTGVGEVVEPRPAGPASLQVGDRLLVSGAIGRHGIAVMCAREQLGFTPPPQSDCAPLWEAVDAVRVAQIPFRAARDATRGGLAAVLQEWAVSCQRTLLFEEALVPVDDNVRGVCELLGLDPIHVANEGTMVFAVPAEFEEAALAALRRVPLSQSAAAIGEVIERRGAPVVVRRGLGRLMPLDNPAGAPLPRIC